jgi:hypothetical protein
VRTKIQTVLNDEKYFVFNLVRYRGYASWYTAWTGIIAMLGVAITLTCTQENLVWTWVILGFFAGTPAIVATIWSYYKITDHIDRYKIRIATQQFTPSLVASLLITFVIMKSVTPIQHLLPGLWLAFFTLGIVASWPYSAPHPMQWVALYYGLASSVVLFITIEENIFMEIAPVLKGLGTHRLPFLFLGPILVVGQFTTAGIFYFCNEKGKWYD